MTDAPGSSFCPFCLKETEPDDAACAGCERARPEAGWAVDPYVGRVVKGKYRIVERLGEGGFGIVVRGRQIHESHDLGDVAIKFLNEALARQDSVRRRFVNEARAARALRGPHIVKVFDFDFDERGVPYLVMEYLDGTPLSVLVANGPLLGARVVHVGVQLADALCECHDAGVLHRDLKPANILLLPDRGRDFVKLIDFGIARLEDASRSASLVGTPRYMAPELILGEASGARGDLYALGVTLHECLCGRPASGSTNLVAREPLSPHRDGAGHVPDRLDGLIRALTEPDPLNRPGSAAEVAARLRAVARTSDWALPEDDRTPSGRVTRATQRQSEETTPHPAETTPRPAMTTPPPAVTPSQGRRRRWPLLALALVGGAAAIGVGLAMNVEPELPPSPVLPPPAASVTPPLAVDARVAVRRRPDGGAPARAVAAEVPRPRARTPRSKPTKAAKQPAKIKDRDFWGGL